MVTVVPLLRVRKQPKNTVNMYLVTTTSLKKKKNLRLVADTVYGIFWKRFFLNFGNI
jgi:hypothetical protein